MAESYMILTLEDMARTYASLPEERGELMLKEMGDAVRMMAPLVEVLQSPFAPVRWINDTKGKADVRLSTEDGSVDLRFKLDLPTAEQSA